jgi:RNA polymerase sigma factor (sigma-70 family)
MKLADDELVRACTNSLDQDLWAEFFARFLNVIAGAVYRTISRGGVFWAQTLEDLTQDACLKIFDPTRKVLAQFESRQPGSVKVFLRTVTKHLVLDSVRAHRHEKRQSLSPPIGIAETGSQIERNLLFQQIDKVLRASKAATAQRDRAIFWFHYKAGKTAREISEMSGGVLSLKGVESTLRRTTKLVRQKLTKGQ